MKIISNFKDYYDFVIGQYGIDEKIVYERLCNKRDYHGKWTQSGVWSHDAQNSKNTMYEVHFCGKIYCVFIIEDKVYYTYEADNLKLSHLSSYDRYKIYEGLSDARKYDTKVTTLNEEHNCPVIIRDFSEVIKNPKLSSIQFAKFVPPHDAYVQIYNFLGRESTIENNQTDIQKVESHGFDKKTSFRKM